MSVIRWDDYDLEELDLEVSEDVFDQEAIENVFDSDPEKRVAGRMDVRAAGSYESAVWSLSRVVGDTMDSGLWQFIQRQGGKSLGKAERFADLRSWCFREVKPAVIFVPDINDVTTRNIRKMFAGVIHEGCSLLLGLKWVDPNDVHQGALVTWDDQVLFSVRVPFREVGNKLKNEPGWTFWFAHPSDVKATEIVEMHEIVVEVPESGRLLNLVGLPGEIDALLSRKRGLRLLKLVRVLRDDGEWHWIPARNMRDGAETFEPILIRDRRNKVVEERPRYVTRVSRFVNMPILRPELLTDGHMRWLSVAMEALDRLGVEHDTVLAHGAVERAGHNGISLHEFRHYKVLETLKNRVDPYPIFKLLKTRYRKGSQLPEFVGRWEWEKPDPTHTLQDFYPRDGEEVYPARDELDLGSEVILQDHLITSKTISDITPIDIGVVAFSHFGECERCGHHMDLGLEVKCPSCGKRAGDGILWASSAGIHRAVRWIQVRANKGLEIVEPDPIHGWRKRYLGGTRMGEFLSAVRRLIRDGQARIMPYTPWMFERDVQAWRAWVDKHGNDREYPGAMLKKLRLEAFEHERTHKKVWFAKAFKDPLRWRRMIFGTPDGRRGERNPNRVYTVRGQLMNWSTNKFALRPDFTGQEIFYAKAYIDLNEHGWDIGLDPTVCPTRMLVATIMNEAAKEVSR